MAWFYVQMLQMHALLAWCSVAFFVARGLAFQFGAAWVMDDRVRTIVFSIDLLMTVSGLSLWALLHHNPLYDAWLAAKLVALVVYTVCAHWAMGRGEFRVLGYLAALAALGYMVGASVTRSAWLGVA